MSPPKIDRSMVDGSNGGSGRREAEEKEKYCVVAAAAGEKEDTGVPVVRLDEVAVTTGEEDEDVLILKHKENGKVRLVLRQAKICSTFPIPDPPVASFVGIESSPPRRQVRIDFDGQNVAQEVTISRMKRLKNYTLKEDELLVTSWQNVSQDEIHGYEQRGSTYWNRVHAWYHDRKNSNEWNLVSDRNANSLSRRWSTIQESVSRFCGAVQESSNFQDQVSQAMTL